MFFIYCFFSFLKFQIITNPIIAGYNFQKKKIPRNLFAKFHKTWLYMPPFASRAGYRPVFESVYPSSMYPWI